MCRPPCPAFAFVFVFVFVAAILAAAPAHAQKSADTLRVAWRSPIPDLDFYHNAFRAGLIVSHQIWDTLVYRDPETFQLKPLLATSWKYTDAATLEFELRQGVTFHDGSPFAAADVAYTVNAALADPDLAVPGNLDFIDRAEVIDPSHVRIKLKHVFPAALEYLAMTLPIYPKAARERLGPDFGKHPVGTGPYKAMQADGETSVTLERNEAYFGGPKGKPAIKTLVITAVPNAAAALAALLGGHADWIWDLSPNEIDSIARLPGIEAQSVDTMRIGYLSLDAAGRAGDTPLTRQMVRQAVMHAINRPSIAARLMPGGRVLDALCYPTQFGCDQAIAVKYGYDPAKSRALLAAAGLPDGFDVELASDLEPQWLGAVQSALAAVGIRARIRAVSPATLRRREAAGKDPLEMSSWGSYSINDASAILPYFFTGGPQDDARDPEVEKLVREGGEAIHPDQRRAAYSAAIKRISEQAYVLPLSTFAMTYAMSKELNFKATRDGLPRFYGASWRDAGGR